MKRPITILILAPISAVASAATAGDSSVAASPWPAVSIGLGLAAITLGRFAWVIRRRLRTQIDGQNEALRVAKARLRSLFENTPVATIEEDFSAVGARLEEIRRTGVTDLRAHFAVHPELAAAWHLSIKAMESNRAMRRLAQTLHTPGAAPGGLPIPPADAVAFFAEQALAIWEGRTEALSELSLAASTGEEPWHLLLHWTVPTTEAGPDLTRAQLTVTDLTALRATEAKLRESEDRWRLAVVGFNLGIWEYSFATREAFFSPRWKAMLGYDPDELPNQREQFWERIHPEDRAATETAMQDHLAGRTPHYTAECRIRCKDGTYKWIRSRGKVLCDEEGRPLRVVGAHADVDEQKRAEAAVRESIEHYRTIFEANPSPMWIYDRETLRFLTVNAAAVNAYGHTREEFDRLSLQDIQTEGVIDPPAMQPSVKGGSNPPAALWRHRRKDGTPLQVEVATHEHNIGGRPGILVVARDVTDQRRIEDALRASEERFRVLFENCPVAILEYDLAGLRDRLQQLRAAGVTDLAREMDAHPDFVMSALRSVQVANCNRQTLDLLGARTREEAMAALQQALNPKNFKPGGAVPERGNVLQKALYPEAFNAGREACLAMWSGTRVIEGELSLQARDGTPRRAHYRCWLPALEDSGMTGGPAWAQAVLVDLTAIRHAEEALAAERERLSVTLQAMAEGVIATDAQGVVQYINEAAAHLTGWSAAGAIGRRIEEVCALRDATTRAPVPVPVAAALPGRSFADLPLNTLLMDRVNVARPVEGRCAPIHDRRDRIAGAVLVLRDVTQHARLEAEMIRASKLESVGMLAGGIAHDFNNLLTGVLGNVNLASLDSPPGSGAGRWLREAEKGLLRARDLTQQLLTFSKGGAPVLDTVDLAEIVRETAQFALHGANVRGVFAFEPELRVAQADKGQIGQVVQNLVLNAVQAMPEGGEVRIALRNERLTDESSRTLAAGDYLRLEITDTGMGISPEHLKRVFEPYFTTKATGIGLGLATVYSIVRQHRGRIEVDSEPGRGSTFRCWLPAAPAPAGNRPESGTPFPAKTKGRLLFMDDEEPIRTMAQALLSRLGFTVEGAAHGEEAIRLFASAIASETPFDLVIMDLTVPGGMGGKETIIELRKLDPNVRAIVSSGYSSDPVMANHRAHGFQAKVSKPYRMADLAKAIASVMAESV